MILLLGGEVRGGRAHKECVLGVGLTLTIGGGAVLDLLSGAFPHSSITGIDPDRDMVKAACQRSYPNDNVFALLDGAGSVTDGVGYLDDYNTLIFCSSLHEIVGPELSPIARERQGAVRVAELATNLLGRGGRVIVQDGVRPRDQRLKFAFKQRSPTLDAWQDFCLEYQAFDPCRSWLENGVYLTDSWTAYEFLTKMVYHDRDNWCHEMHESYGWMRLKPFVRSLEEAGLKIVHQEAYTVPYLAERWAEAGIEMTDAITGEPARLDSTMLVVAERVE